MTAGQAIAAQAAPGWDRIGVILLGAGRGERFGRNKLAEPLAGEPLIRHAARLLAALPGSHRVAVVGPGTPGLADLGFIVVTLTATGQPQSASLAAGVAALEGRGVDAILIALGDMPLVTAAHLERLRRACDGRRPVCSGLGGEDTRCPPAIFPLAWRARLLDRQGDRGARGLLAGATVVPAPWTELLDVDRPEDLAEAARLLAAR